MQVTEIAKEKTGDIDGAGTRRNIPGSRLLPRHSDVQDAESKPERDPTCTFQSGSPPGASFFAFSVFFRGYFDSVSDVIPSQDVSLSRFFCAFCAFLRLFLVSNTQQVFMREQPVSPIGWSWLI
jgi:hypothetical protein